MNISGIRPASDFYDNPYAHTFDTTRAFGAHDDSRIQKPEGNELKVNKVSSLHSNAQVKKAVSVMRRDSSLHKYQKFVGKRTSESFVGRGIMENFNL